jgi:hypothetical protein
VVSPAGLDRISAERVILATGLREAPRSARLIGGDRPWGVLTTGALQSFVYLERLRPFRRPVIVGTELVSFSAILTARKAGMQPVTMIEENGRTTARWPSAWAPRGGPAIDQFGRCSDPTYFAAGNLLRAVETAGWCHREGRRVGGFVAAALQGRLPPPARLVELVRGHAIKLLVPQCIDADAKDPSAMLQLRVGRAVSGQLRITADGQTLWQRRIDTRPERRILIPLQGLSIPRGIDRLHVGFAE